MYGLQRTTSNSRRARVTHPYHTPAAHTRTTHPPVDATSLSGGACELLSAQDSTAAGQQDSTAAGQQGGTAAGQQGSTAAGQQGGTALRRTNEHRHQYQSGDGIGVPRSNHIGLQG